MDIKARLKSRSRGKQVEFLGEFVEVSFTDLGVAKFSPAAKDSLPIETGLLVPINKRGQADYVNAIAVTVSVDGNKLTVDIDDWKDFKAIPESTIKALLSVPRTYFARTIDQLLPGEIRQLTSSSSDVMKKIDERDPKMLQKITEVISDKVKSGETNQSDLNRAVEAAINLELTVKYPDLLAEINEAQQSQPALQAAILTGASADLMRTIQLRIPDGESWIAELLQTISPVGVVDEVSTDITTVDAKTVEVSELDKALAEEIVFEEDDEEEDDEEEDDEEEDDDDDED